MDGKKNWPAVTWGPWGSWGPPGRGVRGVLAPALVQYSTNWTTAPMMWADGVCLSILAGSEQPAYTGGCTESPAMATSCLRLQVFNASTLSASASPRAPAGHRRRHLQRLLCTPLFFFQLAELTTFGLPPTDQSNTEEDRTRRSVSQHVWTSRYDVRLFTRSVALCQMLSKYLRFCRKMITFTGRFLSLTIRLHP